MDHTYTAKPILIIGFAAVVYKNTNSKCYNKSPPYQTHSSEYILPVQVTWTKTHPPILSYEIVAWNNLPFRVWISPYLVPCTGHRAHDGQSQWLLSSQVQHGVCFDTRLAHGIQCRRECYELFRLDSATFFLIWTLEKIALLVFYNCCSLI